MMREWYTAQELAGLPELPSTGRRVRDRATREGWQQRQRAGRGGGLEYHWSALPPAAKGELVRRHAKFESPAGSSAPGGSGLPSPTGGRNPLAAQVSPPSSQGGAAAPFVDLQGAKDYFYDCASENQRAEAQERLEILDQVHALIDAGFTKRAAFKEAGVPHATYYRWMGMVQGHDREHWLELLCPDERGGNNQAEFSQGAKRFLRDHWLDRRKPTKADSISRTIETAKAHGWAVPSTRTMERYLDDLDDNMVRRAREGREVTAELIPPQRRSVLGLNAGDWVNGDGLKLDGLWIKFEDGEIVNGATLWVNQDIRTRRLLNAELGKTETGQLFQMALYGLTAICLPTDYVSDNTLAAASKDMTAGQPGRRRFKDRPEDGEGLLKALGIRLHFTNPDKIFGRPGAKPIERAFRDWHKQIMTNPKLKGTGYSSATAVPVELVREVVEFERRRWNAATGRDTEACRLVLSFDQAWEESVSKNALRKADPRRRRLLLFGREIVSVYKRHNEVRIKAGATSSWGYHRYTHPGLARFRGKKLVGYYDPKDLSNGLYLYSLQGHRYLFFAEHIPNVAFNDKAAASEWRKLKQREVKGMKRVEADAQRRTDLEMQQIYAAVELPDGPDDAAAGNVRPVDFRPMPDPERDRLVAGSDVVPADDLDDGYDDKLKSAVARFQKNQGF